jgi:hypothetical protein
MRASPAVVEKSADSPNIVISQTPTYLVQNDKAHICVNEIAFLPK